MRILILGATGMVGQGALLAALSDPRVTAVTTLGRSATGRQHPRLTELTLPDLFDLTPLTAQLSGFDACFFSLGVSSFRMPEPAYRRVTFHLTLAIGRFLAPRNPAMAFLYVSGTGTRSPQKGGTQQAGPMWARVKGETEDALLHLPFRAAYMLRPGLIIPRDGIRSKTPIYQAVYSALKPALPLLQRLFPGIMLDTQQLGRAMLNLAAANPPDSRQLFENRDLIRLA